MHVMEDTILKLQYDKTKGVKAIKTQLEYS